MSSEPNQPRSPSGTPKSVPAAEARGAAFTPVGAECVIQVEYRLMTESVKAMAESIQGGLVLATQVAQEAAVRRSANGIRYAAFGESGIDEAALARMVQAVPTGIAAALARKTYYFVPLAIAEGRGPRAAAARLPRIAAEVRRR